MKNLLQEVADNHGTPAYVYSMHQICDRASALRGAFGDRFALSYAVKSNPNTTILERMQDCVKTLDISSIGEMHRAHRAGWASDKLSFTGPGKRPQEITDAIQHNVREIVVESIQEAETVDAIARSMKKTQHVLIRINPIKMPRGFGVHMAGKPSQFGIDEEDLQSACAAILRLPNIKVEGFHIFSGTQCLDADAIVDNYEIFIDIFKKSADMFGITPRKLIFGSGLGIPYYESDVPLDLNAIANRVNPLLDALLLTNKFQNTQLVLELGRYLVGEAGLFITSVIAKTHSRGRTICICDAGLNNHLAACGHLGTVIHRNYRMFKVSDSAPNATEDVVEIVGPLCTTIDTLGHNVTIKQLEVGDVIAIENSGAYGLTASPIHFISHGAAKEVLIDRGSNIINISEIQ